MRKLKKIYTLLIVLYPLLSVYSTGIPSLSIADAILIVITLMFFYISQFKIKISCENKAFFCFYFT